MKIFKTGNRVSWKSFCDVSGVEIKNKGNIISIFGEEYAIIEYNKNQLRSVALTNLKKLKPKSKEPKKKPKEFWIACFHGGHYLLYQYDPTNDSNNFKETIHVREVLK